MIPLQWLDMAPEIAVGRNVIIVVLLVLVMLTEVEVVAVMIQVVMVIEMIVIVTQVKKMVAAFGMKVIALTVFVQVATLNVPP